MPLIGRYWLTGEPVPFGTLLVFLERYYNGEIRDDNFHYLVIRARKSDPADTELVTFKDEMVKVLKGDREGLHPRAIITAAQYDDWHTDEEFLAWLWRKLFPDEPLPGRGSAWSGRSS